MTAHPLSITERTLLQKIASDTGFDVERPAEGPWLAFDSSRTSTRLWLSNVGTTLIVVALSQHKVVDALKGGGSPVTNPLPSGAVGAFGATSLSAVQVLIQRAYVFSMTLPDELLHRFQRRAGGMPETTEAERLARQRIGQDVFREGLLELAAGQCMITGITVPEVLRASHIKPWAECETDAERLDVHNGLLLAAHLDALFDKHLISVADDGTVLVSARITPADRSRLGLESTSRVRGLTPGHRVFLAGHRAKLVPGV